MLPVLGRLCSALCMLYFQPTLQGNVVCVFQQIGQLPQSHTTSWETKSVLVDRLARKMAMSPV